MNEGDKIEINGVNYTVIIVEEEVYHLLDDNGNGICVLKTEING